MAKEIALYNKISNEERRKNDVAVAENVHEVSKLKEELINENNLNNRTVKVIYDDIINLDCKINELIKKNMNNNSFGLRNLINKSPYMLGLTLPRNGLLGQNFGAINDNFIHKQFANEPANPEKKYVQYYYRPMSKGQVKIRQIVCSSGILHNSSYDNNLTPVG